MNETLTIEILNIKEENKRRSYVPDWDMPFSFYVGRKIKTQFKQEFGGEPLITELNLKESPLNNPFKVNRESERELAIERYRKHLEYKLQDPMGDESNTLDKLVSDLVANKVLRLACWCSPKKCHAEVIADYVVKRVQEYYRLEGATESVEVAVRYIPSQLGGKGRQKFVQIQFSTESYSALKSECENCQKCELHSERIHSVWSRGIDRNGLMIIGEAPGEKENESGLPFIGSSGKMLEAMLYSVQLRSQDCIVVNAVKCRPPENRNPSSSEIDACWLYLQTQIAYHKPKVILALGSISTRRLIGLGDFKITHQRGKEYSIDLSRWKINPDIEENRKLLDYLKSVIVIPTYHPAYLLRNTGLTPGTPRWQTWQDMIKVKGCLEKINSKELSA